MIFRYYGKSPCVRGFPLCVKPSSVVAVVGFRLFVATEFHYLFPFAVRLVIVISGEEEPIHFKEVKVARQFAVLVIVPHNNLLVKVKPLFEREVREFGEEFSEGHRSEDFGVIDLQPLVLAEGDFHSVVLIVRPNEGGEGEAVAGIGEGDAEEGLVLCHSDLVFWG